MPDGEPGEALLRSPGMFSGYHRQEELNRERLDRDGRFRTGDVLRLDEDGYYHFVGRTGDLIRRAGSNISPVEVQDVIAQHPAVHDVAVLGVPHATYGETVAAAIIPAEGVIGDETVAAEILEFASHHLAEFKLPTVIDFVAELPTTPNGKFDRKQIAALLEERQSES